MRVFVNVVCVEEYTAPACFQGFLCVSAKIRRRRICHLLFEGDERQSLSRALKQQMAKGLSPWR